MSDVSFVLPEDTISRPGETATQPTSVERDADLDLATVQQGEGRTLRKSCNRCHQQKLRCNRDRSTIAAGTLARCSRCRRAGTECVYSERENKQQQQQPPQEQPPAQRQQRQQQQQPLPSLPGLSSCLSGNGGASTSNLDYHDVETSLELDTPLLDFDEQLSEFIAASDSSFAATGASLDETTTFSMQPLQNHDTLDALSSDMSLSSSSGSGGTPKLGMGLADGPPDQSLSASLASQHRELEALYSRVIGHESNGATQNCPIGKIFAIFERFLRVLALDEMVAVINGSTPHRPFDEYMRAKNASNVAACYVLCTRILVVLSEKMLQRLLTVPQLNISPEPKKRTFSGFHQHGSSSSSTSSSSNFPADTNQIPENLTLGDLFTPPTDQFQRSLRSTLDILDISSRLLSRMERSLGIPPELGVGSLTGASNALADQAPFVEVVQQPERQPSLPAQLARVIWEDEMRTSNKSSLSYFRRCRAAILGLSKDIALW